MTQSDQYMKQLIASFTIQSLKIQEKGIANSKGGIIENIFEYPTRKKVPLAKQIHRSERDLR